MSFFEQAPTELQALILSRLSYEQLKALDKHLRIPELTWKLHFEFYFSQVHRPYFDYQKEIENYHWFLNNNANPSIVIFAAQRSYELILEKELQKPDLSIVKVKEALSDCLKAKQYHLVDLFLKYYPEVRIYSYAYLPHDIYVKISKNIINKNIVLQDAIDTHDVELLKCFEPRHLYLKDALKSLPCLKYMLSLRPAKEEVLDAIEIAKKDNYPKALELLSDYALSH